MPAPTRQQLSRKGSANTTNSSALIVSTNSPSQFRRGPANARQLIECLLMLLYGAWWWSASSHWNLEKNLERIYSDVNIVEKLCRNDFQAHVHSYESEDSIFCIKQLFCSVMIMFLLVLPNLKIIILLIQHYKSVSIKLDPSPMHKAGGNIWPGFVSSANYFVLSHMFSLLKQQWRGSLVSRIRSRGTRKGTLHNQEIRFSFFVVWSP